MTLLTPSAAEQAALFLGSPDMARVAYEDAVRRESWADYIDVLLEVTWPELGRATRAAELIDRSVRRCSRAWQDTVQKAGEHTVDRIFGSPDDFLSQLGAYPQPAPTARGYLTVRAADADPATFLLEPEAEVFAVLAKWPLTTIAYAMASFGQPFTMTVQDDCRFEGAMFAPPNAKLVMYQEALRGRWRGSSLGRTQELTVDLPRSMFRTIAAHVDESGDTYGEVRVLMLRSRGDGSQDCVMAQMSMPRS